MSNSDSYSRLLYAVQALGDHANTIERWLPRLYDPACSLEEKLYILQVFCQQGPSMQRALDAFMMSLLGVESEVLG